MTLLTFKNKYVVTSTVYTESNSVALIDDSEAIQEFNLSNSQTVLVIYQVNNLDTVGKSNGSGMQNAIKVDAADVANSWDSPYGPEYCNRNCVFWIGTLAAGDHTIKGRYAKNEGTAGPVGINNRILLIYIFDGDEFEYIDSAVESTTDSTALIDDPQASLTFTPSLSCKALILYNISNIYETATENSLGKKAAIKVGETDYSQAEKSAFWADRPDSIFTVHALSLSDVETTVKGRFAANAEATVTVTRRQLGVLLLDDSTLLNIITSDTQVSTTSASLIDDSQATIERTITDSRDLLVVAMGTKRDGTTSNKYGECYGISVDGVDRTHSRGCPSSANDAANSVATAWAEHLTPGAHTIKGRLSHNFTGEQNAVIDSRRVVALWFETEAILPTGKIFAIDEENNLFRINPSDLSEEKTLDMS